MADLEAAWKKKYGVGDGAQEAQGQNAPSESVMFSAPSVKAEPRVDLEAAWHKRYGLEPPAARPQTSTSTEERAVKEREQGLPLGAVRITYGGELSKAQKHYNDLIRLGANPNEAHLLTGAAASESEFNPTAIHDNRTGYGLYGHRLDRRDALFFLLAQTRRLPTNRTLLPYKNFAHGQNTTLCKMRKTPVISLSRRCTLNAH